MDGISAKRVLIALARMLSFDSVRRENCNGKYQLKLVGKNGYNIPLMAKNEDSKSILNLLATDRLLFTSAKWENALNALVGKTIPYGGEWKKVTSIEELIIDLELKGFLRRT